MTCRAVLMFYLSIFRMTRKSGVGTEYKKEEMEEDGVRGSCRKEMEKEDTEERKSEINRDR